jgi:hypothetical protein
MHHLGGFFARPRPFLPGEFVTTDQGTGLVHMAPDHGEDDFELCKAHGIDTVFAVEGDGRYRADWPWLGGQGSVINPKFNAPDGPICSDLREAGALLAASADFQHSYPTAGAPRPRSSSAPPPNGSSRWTERGRVACRGQATAATREPKASGPPLPSGERVGVRGSERPASVRRLRMNSRRRTPSPNPLLTGERA